MSKALFSKMLAVSTALMLFAGLMTGCTLVGKLLSEKDTGTETETAGTSAESVTESEMTRGKETESEPTTEAETTAETESVSETESTTEPEMSTETETETEPETETEAKTESENETETYYTDFPVHTEALLALLSELAEEYGVIPTAPFSCPASIELLPSDPVPQKEMNGLLAAKLADFDGDEEDEVLTVRLMQQISSDGTIDHPILEIYEYDGDADEYVYSAGRSFSVMNFSGTGYYCSFSVFGYEIAQDEMRIGLEFYGCFSSEMTTVLSLGYNGSEIQFLDGAAYFENDGTDNTRSVYYKPQNTVNGSYLEADGAGFYDWEQVVSSGNKLDGKVLSRFEEGLSEFGLRLMYLRSIYEDWKKDWETRNVDFSKLTAVDCYQAETGEIQMIGSIVSYYTVGKQTLLRTDYTGLFAREEE